MTAVEVDLADGGHFAVGDRHASCSQQPFGLQGRQRPGGGWGVPGQAWARGCGAAPDAALDTTDEEPMPDGPRQAEAGVAPAAEGTHAWAPVGHSIYGAT